MVIGTFPLAKLGVLLVKQISKPIANAVKERAKTHPFFRTYVCLPPAYFYNWCEVKCKMWVLNLGRTNITVPVLSESMAIELGANLLGEGIIFALGAGLLIFEYNRQVNKETAKETTRKNEMENLTGTIEELYFVVQTQQKDLQRLQKICDQLNSTAVRKPWTSGKKPESTDDPPSSPGSGTITPELTEKIIKLAHPPPEEDQEKAIHIKQNNYSAGLPARGVITQSLDYVQFHVFKLRSEPVRDQTRKVNASPSLIDDALNVIQRDLKGLL